MATLLTEARPKKRRRKPTAPVPRLPRIKLLEGDGEPLESEWHVYQMALLLELVRHYWSERDDFFCAANMFVYYSLHQARAIKKGSRSAFRGPDFFIVTGVDGRKPRKYWVAWEEDGKYPDLVVELLSPTTADYDKHEKKEFYAKVFHTYEYFWFDGGHDFAGFRLMGEEYVPIEPNEHGWLWSEVLGAYLGVWEGLYQGRRYRWLRLFQQNGEIVPTHAERAEAERQRAEQALQQAEAERQRAEQALQQAEAERQRAEQLAQRLRELGVEPDG